MARVIMNQKLRKKVGKSISEVMKATYFADGIPINDIDEALKFHGVVMLQEDKTEWSGMFCGEEGRASIRLADYNDVRGWYDGIPFYEPFENVALHLTWYWMDCASGRRCEVIGYVM